MPANIPAVDDTQLAASKRNPIGADNFQKYPANSYQSITETSDKDLRFRLRAFRGQEKQIYGEVEENNILRILSPYFSDGTDGLLFPYTPSVIVAQSVNYTDVGLVHTNGEIYSYRNTPNANITISAKFTVQNQREGRYALAAIHFMRTVSKMHFGQSEKGTPDKPGLAGLPPPILIFRGYGNYMFNNLPVIVRNHNYTLDDGVDTVTVTTAQGVARIPSLFTMSIDLAIQQTPKNMRTAFNLDSFRTGELMRARGQTGWI